MSEPDFFGNGTYHGPFGLYHRSDLQSGLSSDEGASPPVDPEPTRTRQLSDSDCLRLLSDVRVGRIAFSRYALPVIRPVNHIVDAEFVIVYAAAGMGTSPDHHVVTYEADALDHRTLLGWCVAVTGFAEPVTATREIHHYRNRLQRWIPGQHERIVRIVPDIIAGVEYVEHHDPDPSHRPGPPLPPPTFDR